jgi:hypothetical protein
MKIISHRGNLFGPAPETENKPSQIDFCLSKGYDVEVDIWYENNQWWLGHDFATHSIDLEYLLSRTKQLWVHCKNLEALDQIFESGLNYFWHEEDTVTLTSKMWIWTYPCKPLVGKRAIAVMPEKCDNYPFDLVKSGIGGICTDYINRYDT